MMDPNVITSLGCVAVNIWAIYKLPNLREREKHALLCFAASWLAISCYYYSESTLRINSTFLEYFAVFGSTFLFAGAKVIEGIKFNSKSFLNKCFVYVISTLFATSTLFGSVSSIPSAKAQVTITLMSTLATLMAFFSIITSFHKAYIYAPPNVLLSRVHNAFKLLVSVIFLYAGVELYFATSEITLLLINNMREQMSSSISNCFLVLKALLACTTILVIWTARTSRDNSSSPNDNNGLRILKLA